MPNNSWGIAGQPVGGQIMRSRYVHDIQEQLARQMLAEGTSTAPVQHWTQGLARLFQSYMGGQMANRAQQEREAQTQAKAQTLAQALSAMQGRPGGVETTPGGTSIDWQAQPGSAQNAASILAQNPDLAALGFQLQMSEAEKAAARQQRMSDMEAERGYKQQETEADRAFKREMLGQQQGFQRELLGREQAGAKEIAGMRIAAGQNRVQQRPMPPAALRMQNEELDAIGSAASINADLGAIRQQIEGGEFDLGPVTNLKYQAQNLAGASSPESRKYATLKSTLEAQRNASLRLNKGVQTEGDAVRAWNEILTNLNDPKLVQNRLSEVEALNKRASDLRRLNVDQIRTNYGLEPLDVSGYQDVRPSVGAGGGSLPSPAPAAGDGKSGFLGWEK